MKKSIILAVLFLSHTNFATAGRPLRLNTIAKTSGNTHWQKIIQNGEMRANAMLRGLKTGSLINPNLKTNVTQGIKAIGQPRRAPIITATIEARIQTDLGPALLTREFKLGTHTTEVSTVKQDGYKLTFQTWVEGDRLKEGGVVHIPEGLSWSIGEQSTRIDFDDPFGGRNAISKTVALTQKYRIPISTWTTNNRGTSSNKTFYPIMQVQ